MLCFLHDVNEGSFDFKRFNIRRKAVSPGAPPAPVRLPGQNFFEEKFSPFQWTLSVDWTGGDNGENGVVAVRVVTLTNGHH